MNTEYMRVIPRDFYNEAKLLKCMGRLSMLALDGMLPEGIDISISESGEPFNIDLTDDGLLTVSNYPVTVNGLQVQVCTRYNSRENYPLVCYLSDFEETEVLDDEGNFTPEFIEAARKLKQ